MKPAKISSSDLVASSLLERILKGEWRVGERIPSVDQLEKALPVSRVTIHRGVRKLCRQGYLRSASRSGTYVSSNVLVRRILLHTGGDQGMGGLYPFGMVVTRKVEALLTGRDMQVEIHWEARRPLAGSRLATDLAEDHFTGVVSVQSNLTVMLERDIPELLGRLPMVHVGVHRQVPWVFVDMDAFHRCARAACERVGAIDVFYVAPLASTNLRDFAALAPSMHVHGIAASDGEWPEEPLEDRAYAVFLRAWQRLGGKLDAIVVADDILAKGIVQAVLSLPPTVRDNLRIVALTNRDSGIFYPLPVEAIEVDTDQVAREVVALLERQFEQGAAAAVGGVAIAPHPIPSMLTASTT